MHNNEGILLRKFGFYIAYITVVVTILTFGIAMFTPPISGPFCVDSCIDYPYTDITSRFPRDYLWMYPAIFLTIFYVALIVCVHHYVTIERKIFSQIGLVFATISATLLITDYFLQITVIQPSLLKGETDGIPLLTQYNPHGVFIALEELGYLMMSISFLSIAYVFLNKKRLEKAIRLILIMSFILTVFSLIIISISYGIHRSYRFEVVVITINWLTLIVFGILMTKVFKRSEPENNKTEIN